MTASTHPGPDRGWTMVSAILEQKAPASWRSLTTAASTPARSAGWIGAPNENIPDAGSADGHRRVRGGRGVRELRRRRGRTRRRQPLSRPPHRTRRTDGADHYEHKKLEIRVNTRLFRFPSRTTPIRAALETQAKLERQPPHRQTRPSWRSRRTCGHGHRGMSRCPCGKARMAGQRRLSHRNGCCRIRLDRLKTPFLGEMARPFFGVEAERRCVFCLTHLLFDLV